MSKNKSQSSDSKQPYSAWLNNSDCVNKLKTAVEKVGYPLEIAAKRILENNDYYVSHSYYSRPDEDPNTPINEIDIHGTKKVGEFSTKECNISFRLIITGDCKYSSTNDLLVFRSEDINFRLPFPILYNGKGLFEPNSFNHFLFPAIIQNIFEVDVAKLNFHPNQQMGIYGGCCQVVTALAYFAERSIEYAMKNDYLKKYKLIEVGSWFANHPEFDRQNDSEYARSIYINNYLSDVKDFEVLMAIPIIVIGENNGIIEVGIRDNQVVMVPIFLLQIWFTLKMVNGSCIRNPSNNY